MTNKSKLSRILIRSLAILIIASMMFSFSSCGFLFKDSEKEENDTAFIEGLIGVADTFLEGDVEQGMEEFFELILSLIGENKSEEEEKRDEIIDAIGGVGHTFQGAVSDTSYYTAEDAAAAYVEEQVVGQASADVVATYQKGELTSTQIDNLGIPEEYSYGIEAVVEYEVVYNSYGEARAEGNVEFLDYLNSEKKVVVYVIKYQNDWKYFVPMPETGETLNKAMYDSVFNSEAYKNCTLNYYSYAYVETTQSYGEQTMNYTVEMTINQLVKHDYGKVYLEQTMTTVMNGQETTQTIYAYMEETKDGVVCYVKMDPNSEEWNETYLSTIGFSSLDELRPFYDQYLDYTYFTVTDFGFTLADERASSYLKQAFDQSGILSSFDSSDMTADMVADYYVSDGVLAAMLVDATVDLNFSEYGQSIVLHEVVKGETTVTDRGTTIVEKPFEDSYEKDYDYNW